MNQTNASRPRRRRPHPAARARKVATWASVAAVLGIGAAIAIDESVVGETWAAVTTEAVTTTTIAQTTTTVDTPTTTTDSVTTTTTADTSTDSTSAATESAVSSNTDTSSNGS